jgi:CheY-like chemotaxis protein
MDRKPVVMVADDQEDLRWLYQHWLSEAGYHVRPVHDGAWALALIPPDPPDLLLLDLQLPEVDGLEVCRQLRARGELQDLPVLAVTSRTDPIVRDQVAAAGADALLTKPFSRIELTTEVDRLLRLGGGDRSASRLRAMVVEQL